MMTDLQSDLQHKNNQLFTVLKEQIENQVLKPGDRLPPERRLCELYNCSRSTVRNSLKLMEQKQLVDRVRGSGTFVSTPARRSPTRKHIAILVSTTRDNDYLKNDPYLGHIIYGLQNNPSSYYCSFSFLKMSPGESLQDFFESHSPLLDDFDGLICLLDMMSPEEVDYLRQKQKPFVATTAAAGNDPVSYVGIDNKHGLYLATRHLVANGRKNIKFINGSLDQSFHRDRLAGFQKGLAEAGIAYKNDMTVIDDCAKEHTTEILTRLFDQYENDPFDSLIVSCSKQAFIAYQALHQKNLRIPQEIDILLYGDLQFSHEDFQPAIPAIIQPLAEQAKRLLRILTNMIDNDDTTTVIEILQPRLALRKPVAAT